MSKRLKWCVDWNNLSAKEKFLMGAPFMASEDRVYKDMIRQLQQRSEIDLEEWNSFPPDVAKLARVISKALKSNDIWPSEIFLPDDPADIPLGHHFDFTDKSDLFPAAFAIVEKDFGIAMGDEFWDGLAGMTYAQAISEISTMRAKKGDAR